MKVFALEKTYSSYPKSYCPSKKALNSAPKALDADVFCFRGNNLSDKIGIVQSASPSDLEKNIETQLGVEPLDTTVKKFKNGETYVNINDNVQGKDVYLMPANSGNVNDNLMETYLKADAAKRSGAKRVIAVMPSFDYARQEKRTEQGEPIAARLNMDLLKTAGVDEIITTDLHTDALEGFAANDLHITHLESMPLMEEYIQNKHLENIVVVSPDIGGVKRADKLAKALGCDKAIVYKHRNAHNEATAEDLIGDVKDKTCVIYDDIIDTAGTIEQVVNLLDTNGAKEIYVCASHGLFNGDAIQKLQSPKIKEVVVTNSVPEKTIYPSKIKQVDISEQITAAMLDISA